MSFSCIPIGETLISEAARIVQLLGYNAAYVQTEDERSCHRAFWVIYWLEKVTSFFRGRGSVRVPTSSCLAWLIRDVDDTRL